MRITRRRRIAILVTLLAAAGIAVVALAIAAVADTERIAAYWIHADLRDDGLHVTEVIDYDFGPTPRHGIFRNIPDVVAGSVEVSSPTAPDQFVVAESPVETVVKIGDPERTITGRHRYQVDYTLVLDAVRIGDRFAFDAVGFGWDVPISDVVVTVTSATELDSPGCVTGTPWDESICSLTPIGAGRWVAEIDSLSAGDGITLSAMLGSAVTGDAPPAPPTGPAVDPGVSLRSPFVVAVLAALLAAVPVVVLVRRAGRERVWQGGPADAAFAAADEDLPSTRIDEADLGDLATIEFEPPRDLSAVEGALVLDEKVYDHHLSAWLLEAAIRGEIEITGTSAPVLHMGSAPPNAAVAPVLQLMFAGRDTVDLTGYDPEFAEGWDMLEKALAETFLGGPLWDARGRRQQTLTRGFGALAVAGGLLLTGAGAALASRSDGGWLVLVAIGAAVAGAAVAAIVNSFELRIRTEVGTGYWLRIESFRRFVADSEARHVDAAAEMGLLRQYTAWAVALGESKAWSRAVDAATSHDPSRYSTLRRDLGFVAVSSHIVSAARSTSTAPRSSGGGGGGGGAGGGGGGGGGGSW